MYIFTTHTLTKYFAYFCALLFLLISLQVFAQETILEAEPETQSPEVMQEVPPAVVENNIGGTPVRDGLRQQVQERMINLISNIYARLTAGLERMTNIMIRLSTRIEKLKAEGVDTTNAESKLAQANTSLSSARMALESIESAPRAMSGDSPRTKYNTMRVQFLSVRDHLRTTRSQLLEVVAILKVSSVKNAGASQEDVSSSTATSSITSDAITN